MVEWLFSPPNKNNIYPSALSTVADRLSCYCQLPSGKFGAGRAAGSLLPPMLHTVGCFILGNE